MITDTKKPGYEKLVSGRPLIGEITVGIHSAEGGGQHGRFTILDIGTKHEFGDDRVPARSFIRAWFDAKETKLKKTIQRVLKKAVEDGKPALGLERLAVLFQADIQKWISGGNVKPPLKQATIDRKGHDVPLIETGILKSAILGKSEVK